MQEKKIHRRVFLRGIGASIMLPHLEYTSPNAAHAAPPPVNLMSVYIPNGAYDKPSDFFPQSTGKSLVLPRILKGLRGFEHQMLFIKGLTSHSLPAVSRTGVNDGQGGHARGAGSFYTTARLRKSGGIRNNISYDQFFAKTLGNRSMFPALNLGVERAGTYSDNGYPAAYLHMNWTGVSSYEPHIYHPRTLFEKMFATQNSSKETQQAQQERLSARRSILDFILAQNKQLQGKVSQADRFKIEEYLESIRRVERRLTEEGQTQIGQCQKPQLPFLQPKNFKQHFEVMADLATLALECQMTRMVTLSLGQEATNRRFHQEGIPNYTSQEGWHSASHKSRDTYLKICEYVCGKMAYLFDKLNASKSLQGKPLSESTLVSFGGGMASGARHSVTALPFYLFGNGGGTMTPGRSIVIPKDGRLANIWLAKLRIAGADIDQFGDSNQDYRQLLLG